MADVYGRLTGRAGVCLTTLGPGATNLVTGVSDANMDHAPVVAISGQSARRESTRRRISISIWSTCFGRSRNYAVQVIERRPFPRCPQAFKQRRARSRA